VTQRRGRVQQSSSSRTDKSWDGQARYASLLGRLAPLREPEAALRLACYLAALALFSLLTVLGYLGVAFYGRMYSAVVLASLGGAFVLLFVACRSTIPHPLRALLPYSHLLLAAGLAWTLCAACYSVTSIARYPATLTRVEYYWNDAIAMTDCSTDLFAHGHNPYKDFSLGDCFARLHMDGRFTTPLDAGVFAATGYPPHDFERLVFRIEQQSHVQHPAEFESYVSYPAGSFLLPALFYALGWHEMSTFYIACIVAAYLLPAWRAPPRLRLWLLPIALANVVVWDYAIHGYSEGLVVFLILAAWASWRRPWLSAVLMGLAVTTRQDSWFFALFYTVLILRVYGWQDAARRAGVMAVIFAVTNGPFFVQSPADWLSGVLGPVRDPMYQGGQGLIVLAQGGWLPLWPRPVYTALEGAALLVSLAVYARICRSHPGVGLALALVPLVFAWRSLFVYFYLPLPILCLWPLLDDLRRGATQGVKPSSVDAGVRRARRISRGRGEPETAAIARSGRPPAGAGLPARSGAD